MAGVRHVWVRQDYAPTPSPGLVVGWRQDAGGWEAWVVWVDQHTGRLVADWLKPSALRPVPSSPGIGSAYG